MGSPLYLPLAWGLGPFPLEAATRCQEDPLRGQVEGLGNLKLDLGAAALLPNGGHLKTERLDHM